MPKVSVIIPVYNAAPYLRRCLDSVCGQTLRDIEVIAVDDCSTDNSFAVLKEYAARDDRIIAMQNERNIGNSSTRNVAIAAAKGEYLGFVDSDDTVDDIFFEKLYCQACRSEAEIVKGEWMHTGERAFRKKLESENTRIRSNKFYFCSGFWSSIYKYTFIRQNGIAFPDGLIQGGDLVFLIKSVCLAKRVETINGIYYYYFNRKDSISNKINIDAVKSHVQAAELIVDFMNTLSEFYLNKTNYIFIFLHCFTLIIERALLVTDPVCKYTCVQAVIKILEKCRWRYELNTKLAIEYPVLYSFLLAENMNGLSAFMLQYTTRAEFITANLRARHVRD